MTIVLKIFVFVAFLWYSDSVQGQEPEQLLKHINAALSQGDCDRAQRNYNVWKSFTDKSDVSLEHRIAECKGGRTTNNNSIAAASKTLKGIKLMHIKGGTFMMGSPESEPRRRSDEHQHQVTLSGFYISEKEITNRQYCQFLNANNIMGHAQMFILDFDNQILVKSDDIYYSKNQWYIKSKKENHPVVGVSWYGAKAFCDWIGGRLPTEAEWEYACRAGTTTPFNTRKNLTSSQANFNGKCTYDRSSNGKFLKHTQAVGSYPSNTWGLYDMHGNAGEWCSDWYRHYNNNAVINPQGPSFGKNRVIRGGGWSDCVSHCRSSRRYFSDPDNSSSKVGFRIALSF